MTVMKSARAENRKSGLRRTLFPGFFGSAGDGPFAAVRRTAFIACEDMEKGRGTKGGEVRKGTRYKRGRGTKTNGIFRNDFPGPCPPPRVPFPNLWPLRSEEQTSEL